MIPINNIFKLIIVFLICIGGCNTKLHRTDVQSDKRTQAEKRFDPLGFYGDDEIVTGRGRLSDKPVEDEQAGIETDRPGMLIEFNDSTQIEYIDLSIVIFRVQVFASKSFDEAQEYAIEIEPLFPEGVFVEYQAPYYKVRVGEFYDSDDGEIFLEDVKQMGFRNAWLVRVIQ